MRSAVIVWAILFLVGCASQPAPPQRAEASSLQALMPSLGLLAAHQDDLDLSEPQRKTIAGFLKDEGTQLNALNAEMTTLEAALATDLRAPSGKDQDTLARAERLVATEGRAKVLHVRLWLQIRKILTEQQLAKLGQLEAGLPH